MGKEQELFERAINEAYTRQTDSTPQSKVRSGSEIVSRGRRRRATQIIGTLGLTVAVGIGAVVSIDALGSEREGRPVADAPVLGAEKIMEFGGPLAASNDSLFIANGRLSNDAGDMASVARYDLATGEVTDSDPSVVASPLDVALGQMGLWLVQWSGDMPVGGEGHPVNGRIQLFDTDTGELVLDIPREDSAPYDVAVTEVGGREIAWVADPGRDQLLRVDALSGDIETIQLETSPNSVAIGAGAVWVSSNAKGQQGALDRYDLADGSFQTVVVNHCMNDIAVLGTSVWASDYCNGDVHRFDAESGEEMATIAVGRYPRALTTAEGLVWVATGDDIVRVDPDREQVVGTPTVIGEEVEYLVAADDTVFASSFGGVFRLGEGLPIREPAPAQDDQEDDVPVAEETCERENVMCIPLDRDWTVAGAGFGSAWVGNVGEGKSFGIARFDAGTGEEIARLRTDGFVSDFAVDEEWMWALLESRGRSQVMKIDPTATKVEAAYDIGTPGDIGEPSMVAGGGWVWVSGPGGTLTRLMPDGEKRSASFADQLPAYRISNGPLHLAYGEDRLWISYGSGTLGVVDPSSMELVDVREGVLGINAYEVIAASGQIWAPHQTAHGKNIVSYVSMDEGDARAGNVSLLEALPGAGATDGERLWVLQESFDQKKPAWLVEIDPVTHLVVGEPLEVDLEFRGGIAAGDGFIWVTGDKVLYRITPSA